MSWGGMRGVRLAALLTLLALPVQAQSSIENAALCNGSDPDAAIQGCTAMIVGSNGDKKSLAEIYTNRAVAQRNKGMPDQAIADLTKAIELSPAEAIPYYDRGAVYIGQGSYDLAVADLSEAIVRSGNYEDAYYARGLVYARLHRYDLAVADFSRVIVLKPDQVRGYLGRGLAFAGLGQRQRAIGDFNAALKIDPDNRNARDYLGHLGVGS